MPQSLWHTGVLSHFCQHHVCAGRFSLPFSLYHYNCCWLDSSLGYWVYVTKILHGFMASRIQRVIIQTRTHRKPIGQYKNYTRIIDLPNRITSSNFCSFWAIVWRKIQHYQLVRHQVNHTPNSFISRVLWSLLIPAIMYDCVITCWVVSVHFQHLSVGTCQLCGSWSVAGHSHRKVIG